jgi:hypothetical protein
MSATVEMGSTTGLSACVVTEEIQLLGDGERGQARVRVLLGSSSEHVIMCGTPRQKRLFSGDRNNPKSRWK